ncbi:ABC transporter ATP-binding protein [Sphingomonas rhizophila]|uniref:ABC transporter ATP-binding protein n=1 Tax=Sphingomonas rhizophila TaxID=2071607 RepID=A0A7G9SCZ1_9SPHN|nr:ABC transporter ATP-binding protein [Sphingomonas rhizophila]QNN65716.1 ABC transporter ATP-binding protein [Sphingomonas rhizophila]
MLALTLILSLLGAAAELVTIGAVLPVLAIAAAPESIGRLPYVGEMLGDVSRALNVSPIAAAALALAVAAACATAIRLLLSWVTQQFAFGLQNELVMRIFGRVLRQPYGWYLKQNSSALIAAFSQVHMVTVGIILPMLTAITSAVMAIVVIAFLIAVDPASALVAAGFIGLIYIGISLVIRGTVNRVSVGIGEIWDGRIRTMQETLGGMRDILLDQSQPIFEERMRRLEDQQQRLMVTANVLQAAPRLVVEGGVIIMVALFAVWYGTREGGVIAAIPVLGALALGAQRLLPMIQAVYQGWSGTSLHNESLHRVVSLLDTPIDPTVRLQPGAVVEPFERSIALEGVTFGYGRGQNALSDIDLVIRKGERIGLIGKTGSGKSTTVDLIMGLLQPERGRLAIDGETIGWENLARWQAQIAHVPQAIFLTDNSIASNIAFGLADEDVDQDRVRDAARKAGLGDFVNTLPDGLETLVGSGAFAFPADSGNASASPARFTSAPACWCSTRQPAPLMTRPRRQ